jgi:hypothetical protein
VAAVRDVRAVGNGDAAVTTVEAAFNGEHISVWLNGRRISLVVVGSVAIWAAVALHYTVSRRRGLSQ